MVWGEQGIIKTEIHSNRSQRILSGGILTDTQSRYYPEPTGHRAKKGPTNTVACRICEAVYTPSQDHAYLLQAPPMVLESALMSMCHFCFRCRRPACPHCWDNVHGVCGECCQEADLPFRAQAAPLRGVLFATTRQAQLRRKHATPVRLICIRSGRFQSAASIDTAETFPLQNAIIPPRASAARQIHAELAHPEKPQIHPETEKRLSVPPRRRITIEIDDLETRPPRVEAPIDVDQIETQPPPRIRRASAQRELADIPTHVNKIRYKTATIAADTFEFETPRHTFGSVVETIITALLFIILLCIVILVMLAMFSMDANTLIQNHLHIDIRAEVTALWQLISQLHF